VKEFQIDEFKSLHDLSANYRDDKKWIFRGQADKGTYKYQVSTREYPAGGIIGTDLFFANEIIIDLSRISADYGRIAPRLISDVAP
jgi:hypothetical protein